MAAASIDITMPQLGETVTEGTITRWFKAVGDPVTEDEPLFEVSTDKVDTEVPAAGSGFVGEILVAEGETVDVGARLAVITRSAPGQVADDGGQADQGGAGGPSDDASSAGGALPDEANGAADAAAEAQGSASDAAGVDVQDRPDPGRKSTDRASAAPDAPSPDRAGAGATGSPSSRLLSPLVRRLMAEHGIGAGAIEGTGMDGRVTRADVMAHVGRGGGRSDSRPSEAESVTAHAGDGDRPRRETGPATVRARQGDQVVRFSNIRRRTAEHMVRSQATAAHVLVATEIDFDNVDRVRRAERERFKADEGFGLTYLPFVARAAMDAIADFPHVNASVGDDELVVHGAVHLGIAVDLSFEGLIVPVIHDADSKRMRALAREIADLAGRARSRKLSADEIAGSTFTITNPGSYGTFITAPVINQPQVAILSTDGVRKKPVVITLDDGSDAIAIHPVGLLAMSFDHRAFDGAYASAFLARCREILESRDWAQEL